MNDYGLSSSTLPSGLILHDNEPPFLVPSRTDVIVEAFDEEVLRNIEQNSNLTFETMLAAAPTKPVGVAEGDSWFDYLPAYFQDGVRGDLLGHLKHSGRLNIRKVAKAGDSLENMIYGSSVDRRYQPLPAQIEDTLSTIQNYNARFLLFSGGGNDIAGTELEAYLNHASSGLPAVQQVDMDEAFNVAFPKAFEVLIARVKATSPGIHIFLHGYDYSIPDGRGVIRIPFGYQFIGPWLLPAFARKRIGPAPERQRIMNLFIDRFNEMLDRVSQGHENVHYLDLRGTLHGQAEWSNELHPTAEGFGKIASKFERAILDALGGPIAGG